ncbi:MAG TPA: response regulator [Polyangiales bacterium]|nr:response regulator [Polyangiales bacterium]
MARSLRLLIVEDSEDDAALLLRELRKGGYEPVYRQVCTGEDLTRALREADWDIIISDWVMPDFNGLLAYRIVRESGLDIPFLIVSGTIDEENAVEALRAGVHDFMTKGKFARLLPAIDRELRDSEVRRRKREAETEIATQRHEVESSERLLRSILESVPDGVMVSDERGGFVMWNPAAETIMRKARTDLPPEAWPEHYGLHLPDRTTRCPVEQQPLMRALAGERVDEQEQFLRTDATPNGAWLSVKARPLYDGEHAIRGAVAVVRDITGEKATQEQLLMSDRMASLGMLAAGVGHEINNPLAAVIGNLDIAQRKLAEWVPENGHAPVQPQAAGAELHELREVLDDARGAADRIALIVRDLRIFARHENTATTSLAVDIKRLLDSTTRMAWNEIRHRAQIVREYDDLPLVRGSESRLGQVFLNLIVNAAQAIVEGDAEANRIRIAARRGSEGTVVVEIADTGGGIPEDVLQHLFTPFFTTKPAGVGTGLGLAICQRIVNESGGKIWVESTVGRGTTFFVQLLAAAADAPVRSASLPPPGPAKRRAKILVVDDEQMIVTLVRRTLSEHDVIGTTHPREALERLCGGERFDVIFCDLLMPQITGMEIYAELEQHRPECLERLVFMTGGAFTPAATTFLQNVRNDRVEKPFNAAKLKSLVNARIT